MTKSKTCGLFIERLLWNTCCVILLIQNSFAAHLTRQTGDDVFKLQIIDTRNEENSHSSSEYIADTNYQPWSWPLPNTYHMPYRHNARTRDPMNFVSYMYRPKPHVGHTEETKSHTYTNDAIYRPLSNKGIPSDQSIEHSQNKLDEKSEYQSINILGNDHKIMEFVMYIAQIYPGYMDLDKMYRLIHEWEQYRRIKRRAAFLRRSVYPEELHLSDWIPKSNWHNLNQYWVRINQVNNFEEFKKIISNRGTTVNEGRNRVKKIKHKFSEPSSDVQQEPDVLAIRESSSKFSRASGVGVLLNTHRNRFKRYAHLHHNDEGHQAMQNDQPAEETTFSLSEARSAFESNEDFKVLACQPRSQVQCTQPLTGIKDSSNYLIFPKGFLINRCGDQIPRTKQHAVTWVQSGFSAHDVQMSNSYLDDRLQPSCHCSNLEEECLPTKVALRSQAVIIMQNPNTNKSVTYTDRIFYTEHMECACRSRCENRKCFAPLKLVNYTTAICTCECDPSDSKCHDLLDGKVAFDKSVIPIPLDGSHILPPCRHGPMNEMYLHSRRCPPSPARTQYSQTPQ